MMLLMLNFDFKTSSVPITFDLIRKRYTDHYDYVIDMSYEEIKKELNSDCPKERKGIIIVSNSLFI